MKWTQGMHFLPFLPFFIWLLTLPMSDFFYNAILEVKLLVQHYGDPTIESQIDCSDSFIQNISNSIFSEVQKELKVSKTKYHNLPIIILLIYNIIFLWWVLPQLQILWVVLSS
jgi:hypothetical protein